MFKIRKARRNNTKLECTQTEAECATYIMCVRKHFIENEAVMLFYGRLYFAQKYINL